MKKNLTFLLLLFYSLLWSQPPMYKAVPLTLTLDKEAPSVTLEWDFGSATVADITLIKREKGADVWSTIYEVQGTTNTSFTDEAVEVGKIYEYRITRYTSTWINITAYGFMSVAIDAPVVDHRGSILIFIEEALEDPLEFELSRLNDDLRGDGWNTLWHSVEEGVTVAGIKEQIISDYNNVSLDVNAVLLLGEIPVPYSGNTNWDGHGDHQGAWAADSYYSDVDGTWTDLTVNNTSPSRPANDNIPGDGKFDQSVLPSEAELAVGRVDFSNLMEGTFGTSHVELMRRYLDKNHRFRIKEYVPQQQALVDDNFGYFGGEAFAASGYRNFYPLVGVENTVDADWFTATDNQSFLFGYGCGGGSYVSAGGIGHTNNFANDSVNIVFSMLFGSYHGDWDSEDNPFMPAALASRGSILSCSWAGRPQWFYHSMASGETLGECTVATQNTNFNSGYFSSFGSSGTHVTLLGDPTLRAHMVAPVSDLSATQNCNQVLLSWQAPVGEEVIGYNVFRTDLETSNFILLNEEPVIDPSFIDTAPLYGEIEYQVRAIVLTESPSGSYFNTSTGRFIQTNFEEPPLPEIFIQGNTLTCDLQEVNIDLSTNINNPAFEWNGPNGFTSFDQNIVVSESGSYAVTVTDNENGCTNAQTIEIQENTLVPEANPSVSGVLTCKDSSVVIDANPLSEEYEIEWITPTGSIVSEIMLEVGLSGEYGLIITDLSNGCTASFNLEVTEDFISPISNAGAEMILNCNNPISILNGSNSSSGVIYEYSWNTQTGNILSGEDTLEPEIDACGNYELIVTNTSNGCSASDIVFVACDFDAPEVMISGEYEILCGGDSISFEAFTNSNGVIFEWAGPGIEEAGNAFQTVSEPGIYNLLATGANGCTTEIQYPVIAIAPLTFTSTGTIDCDGNTYFNLAIEGGTPPYTILNNPPLPIPPGTNYTIAIIDENNCQVEVEGTTANFEPMSIEVIGEDVSVFGANDGSAVAEIENGIPPFSFQWSNGSESQSIMDLAPGLYSVTVTGSDGCIVVSSIEILEGIVGIEEIQGHKEFSLAPNPTQGRFAIFLSLDGIEDVEVEIWDLTGKLMKTVKLGKVIEEQWDMDISEFSKGVYLFKLKIGSQTLSRRILKI